MTGSLPPALVLEKIRLPIPCCLLADLAVWYPRLRKVGMTRERSELEVVISPAASV